MWNCYLIYLFGFLLTVGHTKAVFAQTQAAAVTIPSYALTAEEDLTPLLEEIGDAEVVLLGEATHGTSELYTWRAAITRRLISEKGFTLLAAESEWADSRTLDKYLGGPRQDTAQAISVLTQFNTWPPGRGGTRSCCHGCVVERLQSAVVTARESTFYWAGSILRS